MLPCHLTTRVPRALLTPIVALIFSLTLSFTATPARAGPDQLILRHDGAETSLAIAELREQADVQFTFFDPYKAEEVKVRGLVFRDLLEHHFGRVPAELRFRAWDDYIVSLGGWDDANWILVTHQNGKPLSLRERGPVRLVERDYGDRDATNLRNFNDWVWMIKSIEAVR